MVYKSSLNISSKIDHDVIKYGVSVTYKWLLTHSI